MKEITVKTLLRYAMKGKLNLTEKDAIASIVMFGPDQLEVNWTEKWFMILGWNVTFSWAKNRPKAEKTHGSY